MVRSWQANTIGKFVFAALVIFLSAVLYEGLKYYREVLFIQSQEKRKKVAKKGDGEMAAASDKLSVKEQILNMPHCVQTILHFGQVFISFMLMLIVMLCNLWLILAVVLGAAVGYFVFGWLRKIVFKDSTDCCY